MTIHPDTPMLAEALAVSVEAFSGQVGTLPALISPYQMRRDSRVGATLRCADDVAQAFGDLDAVGIYALGFDDAEVAAYSVAVADVERYLAAAEECLARVLGDKGPDWLRMADLKKATRRLVEAAMSLRNQVRGYVDRG